MDVRKWEARRSRDAAAITETTDEKCCIMPISHICIAESAVACAEAGNILWGSEGLHQNKGACDPSETHLLVNR